MLRKYKFYTFYEYLWPIIIKLYQIKVVFIYYLSFNNININHIQIFTFILIICNLTRYYGVNDPVAEKMMNRANEMPKLEKPEDQTISTLYVGNLNDITTEKDLK